eukprot:c47733_g1_i1 orf=9-179(+)
MNDMTKAKNLISYCIPSLSLTHRHPLLLFLPQTHHSFRFPFFHVYLGRCLDIITAC